MKKTLNFNNIRLYGYHGTHPEEVQIGAEFYLSISAVLKHDSKSDAIDLDQTLDYERLYPLLKSVFTQRETLIENVVGNIYKDLKSTFPQVYSWKVCLTKQNPLGQGTFNPEFCMQDDN